jgi:hypothetical protein
MPRTPRLTAADRAEIAARHEVVTGRVMAAEDIARTVIRQPVRDATRHLVSQVAGEGDLASVKRAVYNGVRSVSDRLASAAQGAVEAARGHARNLSNGQAHSDLGAFAQLARGLGFHVSDVNALAAPAATAAQDAAISQQAGMVIGHRWSSEALSNYVQWKREGGGMDQLMRRFQGIGEGNGGLGALVETQAITQSIDAYADEHALTWRNIAEQAPGSLYDGEDGAQGGWGAGLFNVWSAVLDRGTCGVCWDLDGDIVPAGSDWPGAGRPPSHARCRCEPVALFLPEAALKALPGVQLDYGLLKEDVRSYMRGSSLNIGEGRRHAQVFFRDAMAGHSPSVLAEHTSRRRSYFPGLNAQHAPRLLGR